MLQFFPIAASFLLSALATPIVRALARRFGAVAAPRSDRWHSKPTAMFGGTAIFIGVLAMSASALPHSRDLIALLGASSMLFIVGFVDDLLKIKPYQKLIGQIIGAATVIYFGLVLPWTSFPLANIAITFVWLVGITNAVNMLDNMDGLSSGVAAIAAIFLCADFALKGQWHEAELLAIFAAALLGFLLYNHNPASIFMGDCGSMFIGFLLAGSALLSNVGGRSRSISAVLAVPILVLLVPIFDTTFVTLVRKLAGRAASQGGRDHTSHRLVALGLSEKHAVWLLYALAVSGGLLALLVHDASIDVSIAAMIAFTIALTFIGIHLGRVRVYDDAEGNALPFVAILIGLSHKRRLLEVGLDVALITLAYYISSALKFGPFHDSADWRLFVQTLPIVVVIKLTAFLAGGIYRGIWRYASVANVLGFARATAGGSVATVLALVLIYRFEGFSRTVMAVDAILLFVLLTGSRFAFRVLRRLLPASHAKTARRALIYGADDGGELLYRELRNNPDLLAMPVAFFDDDAIKSGRLLHGLRIYTPPATLEEICRRFAIEQVMIAGRAVSGESIADIIRQCEPLNVRVYRAAMTVQQLSPESDSRVLTFVNGRG